MPEHRAAYEMNDFAIGYARDKGDFRVCFCLFIGFVLIGTGGSTNSKIALFLGLLFLLTAYYFYPLVETHKIRFGAGEYGIFIEGFGVIPWRAVGAIELSTTAVRTIEINELNIELSRQLPHALIADWRSLPWHRLPMKLPWRMGPGNVVRINLEPFAADPEEILTTLQRMQQCYSNRHRSPL